jgi:PAS domain S-box-containing protein
MNDDHKTKKQLIHELTELRSQNAALEKSTTGIILAELAAEEARRYAESIVATVREPLLVLDADLKIISANRNFYRTFKVAPDETIGMFIYDLGNKQWDIPKLRELLEEVLPEKEAFDDFEVAHIFQDIGQKTMRLNARQIYRKDIGAKMILLAIEDITERKQLEDLLRESEERFRRLFETASDGIVLLEKREGKITQANPATEKLLGYTQKESIGNSLQDIGVVLDTNDFQTTMQNLNESGIINYRNVKVETKSGQRIDTEIYLVDRAKLVQCNIRDITERKRTKEALRDSEQKYHWIVDNMADVITVMDMNLRFTYVSPSIIRLRGYTPEEAVAQPLEQMMTPESLQIIARVFEEEMKLEASGMADPGRSRTLELEEYRKDGSIVWSEDHLSFLRDEAKKPVGIIALSRDITERKRADEALRESEEKHRLLFDSAGDAIFIHNAEAQILAVNPLACNRLGYTHEHLMSMKISQVDSPGEAPYAPDRMARLMELGELAFETVHQRSDGSLVPTDVIARRITWNGQPAIMSICRDITDRKLAEKNLQDTLESLRKAFATTIQVMVSAVESRDPYTAGHQIRSANLALAIATEMGLPQEKIEGLRIAGSIHDIGKLSIPAEILSKPTKLSEIEFSLIKEHSLKGYEMLKDVESPWPLAQIVYQHHERMDGSGYPRNLKGDEIIMEARILAVADVVEAVASHRPYRPAIGVKAALEEIEKNKGTLYDDAVADACLRLFREKGFQLEGADLKR